MISPRLLAFCICVAGVAAAVSQTRAAEHTVALARSDCELAVRYAPPVGVDYQPGVDVYGRPVVPADVDGERRLQLPETIPIIVTEELRQRFGLSRHSPLLAAEALVGVVELHLRDGRLTFNGAELTDRDSYALSFICREAARHP